MSTFEKFGGKTKEIGAMTSQSEYELERLKNIERNKRMLESLGLNDTAAFSFQSPKKKKKKLPKVTIPRESQRRSGRIQGKETAPEGKGIDNITLKKKSSRTWDYNQIVRSSFGVKEEYTEEHIKMLGDCKTIWPHVNFEKTYDPIRGTTCHQCRQKTKDTKTICSKCDSIRGQFCGTCLQNRYGENLDEVLALSNWICPPCRMICNCSICRGKLGLAPTGIMAPEAQMTGFKSVAHYLVHTYQKKDEEDIPILELEREKKESSSILEPKEESEEEEYPIKYSKEDFDYLELVACRPDSTEDKFWIGRVVENSPKKRKKNTKNEDSIRIRWFEKVDKSTYYESEAEDSIAIASIFHKGFTLKQKKDKTLFILQEDLSKYDR